MPFSLPARVLMADAPALLAAGSAALGAGERVFDLSAVTECDSSLIACLTQWRREVRAAGGPPLEVLRAPDALRRLARLYGVEQLAL